MSESQLCARAVIGQLIAQGVSDVVLCPGSRSAGLALCLDEAARSGLLRLHVRLDERVAAFTALGLGKGSGRPAAVVTTSGTAVANLAPAVLEAHHAGVPLVVVSADRPAELVGVGANQATEQTHLFAGFLRYRARIGPAAPAAAWRAHTARAVLLAAGATGGTPGPVQLNVELPAPLVSAGGAAGPVPGAAVLSGPHAVAAPSVLAGTPRTLVVCGDASVSLGRLAAELAEAAGLPLVAEASSNARVGGSALACGRLLLAGPLGEQVERVIVFGRPSLSRPVTALLSRDDVELVVVTERPDYVDPGWRAALVCSAVDVEPGPADWLDAWRRADAECSARVLARTSGTPVLTGPELARLVVAAVPGDQLLCLANSNPIRDADLAPIGSDPAPVHANRGLSGIDGTVSTAIGVALGGGRPTTLLCGDLAFVHDAGALAIAPGEPRPELRVVVADDAGGSIFATLEYGRPEFAGAFERVFATPTGVDLVAMAAGFGVPARRLSGADEVAAALAEPITGFEVLVVDVDRTGRASLASELAAG
ncbi:MAG: 2-succinyl-5-enolpyruvyl-6-hydroxy-3-cyclohexene-1-carboxylic-acid synthase [Propionibacteriaceae bacterium]|nr:2-succinyl-5-enolpyruvyl-6-hydroxy-3-cyclohexene-1-carboxylic-acid synthase [Propionibacteriaceae bacterium]